MQNTLEEYFLETSGASFINIKIIANVSIGRGLFLQPISQFCLSSYVFCREIQLHHVIHMVR